MFWKTISSDYISNHIYFTARRDKCQRDDGTIVDPYFVVELPTSATALALTTDNRVIMVKQYRHPIGEVIIETPGGFIDPGEDFAIGMNRELLEETGYSFQSIESLGRVAANPGVLNNYTELFLARGGVKQQDQMLDHNEEIEVVEISINDLKEMLLRGDIKQSLHVNCIFYALLKMGQITFNNQGITSPTT
ncbi:NUDIX hydrolase [Flavihumibacter sp.]|uniref:NUDIX hydrolase n=1 Tax=Flavihumibacter sp. TaxID=1913981 RepID=UPI002FC8A429